MRVRKIRSTLAAFCGIAFLTFLPLWVRSYSRLDTMRWLGLELKSGYGITMLRGVEAGPISEGRFHSQAMRDWTNFRRSIAASTMVRGGARFGEHFWIVVPYWMLIVGSAIAGAIAGRPWLPLRFNLLTLLFATILIAFMLGLSIYAAYREWAADEVSQIPNCVLDSVRSASDRARFLSGPELLWYYICFQAVGDSRVAPTFGRAPCCTGIKVATADCRCREAMRGDAGLPLAASAAPTIGRTAVVRLGNRGAGRKSVLPICWAGV